MKKEWVTKKLADVTTKIGSGATPRGGDESYKTEGISLIRSLNVYDDGFRKAKLARIDDAQADDLSNVVVEPHDVLLNITGASVARCCLAPAEFLPARVNQHVSIIRPIKGKLDSAFLHHLLISKTYKDRLLHTGEAGSTRQAITKAQLQEFSIEYPERLAEQQRIVGILDEAFAGIATAKANAEKNLRNAGAISESHLQSVFTQRGKGWAEKMFEELIETNVIGLTKNSREQGEDKAWPYVKMNNITRDNRFDFSKFTCVDATAEEVSKYSLEDGDFLFNTRNSYELVGKSCIYESDSNDAVLFNNNIMRVRFKSGIDARFILLAFSSKGVADELNALKSGTTNVSAIYFKDLKSLVIPVAPIAAQKSIAAKLESLAAETQRLASLYERKLAALDALKKSLLHQAFTGAL